MLVAAPDPMKWAGTPPAVLRRPLRACEFDGDACLRHRDCPRVPGADQFLERGPDHDKISRAPRIYSSPRRLGQCLERRGELIGPFQSARMAQDRITDEC